MVSRQKYTLASNLTWTSVGYTPQRNGIYLTDPNAFPQPSDNQSYRGDIIGIITNHPGGNLIEVTHQGYIPSSIIGPYDVKDGPLYVTAPHTPTLGTVSNAEGIYRNQIVGYPVSSANVYINVPKFFCTFLDTAIAFVSNNGASGSGVDSNAVINGSFDIWQRNIGTSSVFEGNSGSSSLYFADRWTLLNGITSTEHAFGGTFGIEKRSFTQGQTACAGEPDYYARITNNYYGYTASDYVHVENRLTRSDVFLGLPAVASFYEKCGDTGVTYSVVYKQYFADGESSTTTGIETVLGTFSPSSTWTRRSVTLTVPGLTGSQSISGDDHYAANCF